MACLGIVGFPGFDESLGKGLIGKAPELLAMVKDSSVNAQVSMIIYDARKQADPAAVGGFGGDDSRFSFRDTS